MLRTGASVVSLSRNSEALLDLALALNAADQEEVVVRLAGEYAAALCRAELAGFSHLQADGELLHVLYRDGSWEHSAAQPSLSEPIIHEVFTIGRLQRSGPPDAIAGGHPDAERDSPRAQLSAPLLGRDSETIGVLSICSAHGGPAFSQDDELLLSAIAAQAAAALGRVRAEARFRALVQHASDIIILLDRDATIRYVSASAQRVAGVDPATLIGTSALDWVHPDDLIRVVQRLAAVGPGAPRDRLECRVRHADGSWLVLELAAQDLSHEPAIGGIVLNARDVTERVRAEEALRRANQELQARKEELQRLVGRLITTQEEERRRVAYALHDGLAQIAAAAHQHLQAFAYRYRPRRLQAREELNRSLELAQRSVREARRVVDGLRPTVLDDFGLAPALNHEVESLRAEGWQVEYTAGVATGRLPAVVETTLFRVAQEAIANARRHAGTLHLAVTLEARTTSVRLAIADFGRGFDLDAIEQAAGPSERVGMASMYERVALLGGELRVLSAPGKGTRIVAQVPLPVRGEVV